MSRLNSSLTTNRRASRVSTGTTNLEVLRSKMSSARQVRTRDIEDFLLVWLNLSNDEFDARSLLEFRSIFNSIKKFLSGDECFDYLKEIQQEKVFLIVSKILPNDEMSKIEDLKQIQSIYVFSDEQISIEFPWNKVRGVFKNVEQIVDEIKRELLHTQNDLTPFNLIGERSIELCSQLDPSFMYAQLLKEIIVQLEFSDEEKRKFIEFARFQYAENEREIQQIDEFDKTYRADRSIFWFKKTSFLSQMLNKALRTQDTEIILKMAFFIKDLQREIERREKLDERNSSKFFVYRTQKIFNFEFEKLRQNKNAFLSFNNFLLCTENRQKLASNIDFNRQNDSFVTSLVFQIEIDPSNRFNSFVLIDENEKDFLFSMHSIFRVEQIQQLDERSHQILLTFPKQNDPNLNKLIQYVGQVTKEEFGTHRIAKFMLAIDKIDKAQEIYLGLLQNTKENDDKELAYLTYQLGYIDEQKGNLTQALDFYEQSLIYQQSYLKPNDPELCPTFSNIGLILKKQELYDEALEYFRQALDISLVAESPDEVEIALRYIQIGGVFDARGQSSKALENYKMALDLEIDALPNFHPLIGATHNNIGMVYYSIKDYSSALTHFLRALEIEEKSVSSDHPSLIMTLTNLVGVLENLQRYKEALEFAEKASKIASLTFSVDHPQVVLWNEYIKHLRGKQ